MHRLNPTRDISLEGSRLFLLGIQRKVKSGGSIYEDELLAIKFHLLLLGSGLDLKVPSEDGCLFLDLVQLISSQIRHKLSANVA